MQQSPMALAPFADFKEACGEVLRYLSKEIALDLWMMTRTEGDDWIVLQANDRSYGVSEGTVFSWADSFCSRMVVGDGPMAAHDATLIPVYQAAPIAQKVKIGAYIGVPILRADGSLFGTLCGIDPAVQQRSIEDALPMVELLGKLLGVILSSDLKAMELARTSLQMQQDALTDVLTGLLNRRGWEKALGVEEERAHRYGSPICILIIDLDELKEVNDTYGHDSGDQALQKAANALKSVIRESDTLARLGGDEFGVMAVECDKDRAAELLKRVRDTLHQAGVQASVGMALRNPLLGLVQTVADADREMYAEKSSRR